MQDRDVKVTVTMKASEIETVREWFARAGEFPEVAFGYASEIGKLLSKDVAELEDGEALAKLVEELSWDAQRAMLVRAALAPILKSAIISDPEGRQGPLQ